MVGVLLMYMMAQIRLCVCNSVVSVNNKDIGDIDTVEIIFYMFNLYFKFYLVQFYSQYIVIPLVFFHDQNTDIKHVPG